MIQCSNCGSEIPDQYQFCGICGSYLSKNISGASASHNLQIKRTSKRYVTVLFADLTNFTQASTKVDPEGIYLSLQSSIVKLAQPITHYGGRIDRYVGDGFLATFGVPIAHEDDPIRALSAAIEMQSIIDDIHDTVSEKINWDVELRIGINAGQVISGQIDQEITPESSVFGHAVNLAKRLQEAARPGTILVSEEVHRLTSTYYQYQEPIQFQLKGIDKPVIGYELKKKRKTIHERRGLVGRKTPLIGRENEYQELLSVIQNVKIDQTGIIALISGEAGIGKSRLIEEVITPIVDNYQIIKTTCTSSDSSNYQLLINIIEQISGINQEDSLDSRYQIVNGFLSSIDTLTKELQEVIRYLVTKSDQKVYDEPQEFQHLLYVAMRRVFTWLVKNQSLLLIIDDLQWSDPSSINILTICADLVRESPIALILSTREYFKSELPKIFVQPQPTYPNKFIDLELQPLSIEDSDHLIHLLLSRIPLPEAFKEVIIERSDGNPLMIEEIVRMLLDRRIIYESKNGWEISEKWQTEIKDVPETVYGLILNRYDSLDPLQKKILDAASVMDGGFSVATLSLVLDKKQDTLRKQISYLENSDFLRRSITTRVPIYYFRHALLREAIYNTILQSERQRFHLKAAQAIQESVEEKSFKSAVRIGHHLERGHSPQAIIYLMEAAEQAERNFANQEAIAYYEKAQKILHETESRQDLCVDTALGIGRIYSLTNDLSAAKKNLRYALTHSLKPPIIGYRIGDINYELGLVHRKIGSQIKALNAFDGAHTALLEAPTQSNTYSESDIQRNIGWIMLESGKLDEAKSRAEKSLLLAKDKSDLTAMSYAYSLITAVHYWSGNWHEAVEAANNSLKIRESTGNVWGAASTQSSLGFIYYRMGDWKEAERILRQAIFVQQEIGDFRSLGLSWSNLGLLLLDSNKVDDALHSMNQALATLTGQDIPQIFEINYRINRGYIYIRMGNYDQSIFDLNFCIEKSREINMLDQLTLAQAYLAEANLGKSRSNEAKSILGSIMSENRSKISDEIWAEVHRVNSLIERNQHNWERSLQANQESKFLYQKLGDQFETALRDIDEAEIQIARYEETHEPIDQDSLVRVQSALSHFRKLNLHHQISRGKNLLLQIKKFDQTGDVLIQDSDDHLVSVIFFRIDPPLELSDTLDQQELVATSLDRLKIELRKTGTAHGAVVTVSGKGLTFLYSDPKLESNQDLALRAIRSALAAINTASRYNRLTRRQYGFEIPIRVGITWGYWQGPFDSPQETAIFSNISPIGRNAQSIAKFAQNNQILLTEQIANIVRNEFEIEEIDSVTQTDDIGPLFRLGRARSEIVLPQALPKSSPRLIGRDEILSKMRDCIDQICTESHGIVSYIEGEAGMGKTRLLEEILSYAEDKLFILQGKSESFRSTISFWPLIDMLDQAEIPETPVNRRLKSLLGLRAPDDLDDNLFRNLPPVNLRPELFGRVREFLLHEASQKPILLVFEDVHCIDLSSLDLIDYLLPLTLDKRISIFMIARAEMPGPHRAIVSKAERVCQDRYLHIKFSSLSDSESHALIHSLLESDSLPSKLWNHLEPFSGHPLSIEEALRFLVERGWLWRSNGSWMLSDFETETDRRMPTSYRELLLTRLNNLENETLHVLQAAAVLGENFDHNVLSRIVPEPTLHGRLTELVERGWLYQIQNNDIRQHRFKHTLTRETIYRTLMASKRQVLHQRSGEAIENLYPESEEENSELLAYHFGNSGQREKAVHYLLSAADKSASRFALAESLNYYQRSLKLLYQDPDLLARYHERVGLGIADVHLAMGEPNSAINDITTVLESTRLGPSSDIKAALLRRLGSAKRQMGEYSDALNYYRDAISIFNSKVYSARSAPKAGIDSISKELWRTELEIAQTYFDMRENDQALEKSEFILSSIDHSQFPQITAETFNLLGGVSFRQGDIIAAAEMVQQSITIYQSYGNRSGAAATYSNLGILAASQQDLAKAHDNFSLSLAIREALGDSLGIAITRNNLGQLEKDRGRLTDAMNHLKMATKVARNSDLTQVLAQSLANLGLVKTLSGKLPEAITTLDEAKMLCRRYNFQNLLCEVQWKQASCYLDLGSLKKAEKTAISAIELATELESQDLRSESQRVLSRIYRKMSDAKRSLSLAKEAWETREGDPNHNVRARFAGEYALSLIANGDAETAKRIYENEIENFDLDDSSSIMQELNEALG